MTIGHPEFDELAQRAWESVPPDVKERIKNVALFVEDEPDQEVRRLEDLHGEDTLLGLYRGIPLTERGEAYGVGMTLPDTITLYRLPILEVAEEEQGDGPLIDAVRRVIAETLWHEVGHYFGLTDDEIHEREAEGTNHFLRG